MRTVPSTVSQAAAKDATQPVFLVRLSFATENRAATFDTNIAWNGETWVSSGIEVQNLTKAKCMLEFPIGASDPWLSLVLNDGTRGRAIQIYLHYTDDTLSPQADAVLLFTGVMDEAVITDVIKLVCIESSQVKKFPPDSVDTPTFTNLLKSGDRIDWGIDAIVVN